MDKSEKSFYVIIKNKKCGKFFGAGPIQVAKKVASKKLKSGKEITFYLDEVCGKKKRYGPYQARKDKKSGQVSIITGKNVMKGGLLSSNDMYNLREIFKNFNDNCSINQNNFVKSRLPLIPFGREPIVYFYPVGKQKVIYKFAVFKERIGNIYIMICVSDLNIEIIGFDDFFLNQYYSKYLVSNRDLNKEKILKSLQNLDIIESRTIREEARKIYDILYIPTDDKTKQKVIIYVPNYYQPLIRKCVYPDLTFGILDEQTSAIIPQNKNDFPIPESPYQKYLIFKKTGMSGMSLNEPIIYVRKITINRRNQRGGNMTIGQIDNYLIMVEQLISKINIRNKINKRNLFSLNMKNIALTTPSGIKKMNDDISKLEQEIILKKKSEFNLRIEKNSQLGRLNELKIVLLQRKLELQEFKNRNEQQLQKKQTLQKKLNGLQKQKELQQVFNGLQKKQQLQEFKQEQLPKFQTRNEQLQKLQKQQQQLKEIQEQQQQLQKKQEQQQQFQQQKLQQQQLLEQQLLEQQKLKQQLNKFSKIKNLNEQQLQQLQQQTKNINEQLQKLQEQEQQLKEIQEQQQLLEQQLLEPEIKEKQLQLQLQLQQQQKLQKQHNEFPGIKNLNEQELQQQIQNIQNQKNQQLKLNKLKKQQQFELNKVKKQQLNKLQQQLNGLQEFKKLNEQHLQQQIKNIQDQQLEQLEQHFDYCIYSSGLNQLKIISYDNNIQDFSSNANLILIDKEIFQTLINIPKDFGKLQHIRDISEVRHQQVQQIQQVQQVQQVQVIRAPHQLGGLQVNQVKVVVLLLVNFLNILMLIV